MPPKKAAIPAPLAPPTPPAPPPSPELVAATLALWLYLTTSPNFVNAAGSQLTPNHWSTQFDDLPANIKALEAVAGNRGVIQKTMDRLAKNPTHKKALIAARAAFQFAFSPDRNENAIPMNAYPHGGTCPENVNSLLALMVGYPAPAAAQAVEP